MKRIKIKGYTPTQIRRIPDAQGKSLEEEIRAATTTKAPIESIAPEIYTPLKDGVLPQYDIRTDRQELALDVTEKAAKSNILHNDEMPDFAEIGKDDNKDLPKNE